MLLCSCISEYARQKFIKTCCDIMLGDFELSLIEYDNILIIRGRQLQRKFFTSLFITLGIISTVFELTGSKCQRLAVNNTS